MIAAIPTSYFILAIFILIALIGTIGLLIVFKNSEWKKPGKDFYNRHGISDKL